VSNGPGSYTGTRIGVTTAKTLAWSLNIPIYTVSSLKNMAYNGVLKKGYIVPFFDARRKTVFTGLYYSDGENLTEIKQEVNVPMEVWLDELKSVDEDIMFLSPHMDVFQEMIESQSNTYFHIPVQISHI